MDLSLNEDQTLLVDGLQAIVSDHGEPPQDARHSFAWYDHALDAKLAGNGYLDAVRTPGMGALEAAMVVYEAARAPGAVEVGVSTLVAPHLGLDPGLRPFSVFFAGTDRAVRFLTVAKAALIVLDDDLVLLPLEAGQAVPVESMLAYPYGKLANAPDLEAGARLGAAAREILINWQRVALAAEAGGAMRSAIDFTVDYVRERRLFGKSLGAFQAVQHRLAQCHQIARAAYVLTMKAAWSGDPYDAAVAAAYVQQSIPKVMFDLHQFNGAMGLTNEHLLHFWTYRMRALQGEMGGGEASGRAVAEILWGQPAA